MEKCSGKSAGGILQRDGKIYLIDRKFEPLGWAGIAGHVETSENPAQCISRECSEETGLIVETGNLLIEEAVPWNNCWKSTGGHYWHVFALHDTTRLQPTPNPEEAKGGGWFSPEEIQHLQLEPVWRYFFEKLGIIKPQPEWHERDQ